MLTYKNRIIVHQVALQVSFLVSFQSNRGPRLVYLEAICTCRADSWGAHFFCYLGDWNSARCYLDLKYVSNILRNLDTC